MADDKFRGIHAKRQPLDPDDPFGSRSFRSQVERVADTMINRVNEIRGLVRRTVPGKGRPVGAALDPVRAAELVGAVGDCLVELTVLLCGGDDDAAALPAPTARDQFLAEVAARTVTDAGFTAELCAWALVGALATSQNGGNFAGIDTLTYTGPDWDLWADAVRWTEYLKTGLNTVSLRIDEDGNIIEEGDE